MISRGSTPILLFSTNTDLSNASVHLTFKQGNTIVLDKTEKELEIAENSIGCSLSQKDTLRFNTQKPIEIQLRYVNDVGYADVSNIVTTSAETLLRGGVIEYRN